LSTSAKRRWGSRVCAASRRPAAFRASFVDRDAVGQPEFLLGEGDGGGALLAPEGAKAFPVAGKPDGNAEDGEGHEQEFFAEQAGEEEGAARMRIMARGRLDGAGFEGGREGQGGGLRAALVGDIDVGDFGQGLEGGLERAGLRRCFR